MTNAEIFDVVTLVAMVGWAVLVFLPFWRHAQIVPALIIPGLLGVAYVIILSQAVEQSGGFDVSAFSSFEGVKSLMGNDTALLAGWIHYLAFDLFVGAWEARDAKKSGVPHWLLVPCLFFTLMSGPFGLVLYLLIRTIRTRRFEGA